MRLKEIVKEICLRGKKKQTPLDATYQYVVLATYR